MTNETSKVKATYTGVVKANHFANLYFIRQIEDAIVNCYGPKSGYTFLTEEDVRSDGGYSTKDGVTIIASLKSSFEPIQMWISQFRNMGLRNDSISGDGTTTTALLAIALYRACVKLGIKKIRTSVVEEIIKALPKMKIDTSNKEECVNRLLDAATISLNNHRELAEILRDTMMKVDNYDSGVNIVAMQSGKIARTGVHSYIVNGVQTVSKPLLQTPEQYENKVFKVVALPHTLEGVADVTNIIKLITAASSYELPILICSPSINTFVKEEVTKALRILQTKNGMSFDFEMLELVHPMDDDNIKASDDIALALGCPRIPISPLCHFNDNGEFVPAESAPEIKEAVYNILNNGATATISRDGLLTKVNVLQASEEILSLKEKRILDLKEKIDDERNITFKEVYQTRLAILTSTSIMVEVGGASNEEAKKLTSMYRDAANHMNAALKSGLTGGANIGMIRAAFTVQGDSQDKGDTYAILEAYCNLFAKLIADTSADGGEEISDVLNYFRVGDVNKTPTTSYDILNQELSESVVSAVSMEERMLMTAYEFTNMWLSTNQVIFGDVFNAQTYKNVVEDIKSGEITNEEIFGE